MGFLVHPTLEKATIFVARSNAIQIRLVDEVRYFWLMIIPETTATELHELDEGIAGSLWAMTRHLGGALKTHCNAAKIKTAAISNIAPNFIYILWHGIMMMRQGPDNMRARRYAAIR